MLTSYILGHILNYFVKEELISSSNKFLDLIEKCVFFSKINFCLKHHCNPIQDLYRIYSNQGDVYNLCSDELFGCLVKKIKYLFIKKIGIDKINLLIKKNKLDFQYRSEILYKIVKLFQNL